MLVRNCISSRYLSSVRTLPFSVSSILRSQTCPSGSHRWGLQATKSAAESKSIALCLIELADGICRVKRLEHGIACHEHIGPCFFEVRGIVKAHASINFD